MPVTTVPLPTGIKSVTRGILTIANAATTATATIPAVTLTKTEVRYLGNEGASGSTTSDLARLYLNNATTIGAIRNNSTGAAVVSYEITEWL